MTLDEVYDFIQYFVDYLDKKGYSKIIIQDVVKTMDILFQLTVREKLDYCHRLLDCYAENLTPYLYTYQVHFMDDLIKELRSKTVKSTVQASIYCSDVVEILKIKTEIQKTDDISDFYGNQNDLINDEYIERDKQVIAYLNQHPEIKKVIEEKIGEKISFI